MEKKISTFVKNIRLNLLNLSFKAKSSHIGSCLSIVEILTAIYEKILKKNDSFILSKGHAGLAMYCLLYEKRIISLKSLNSYGKNNSILMGHISHKVKGVEFSTGSLGHGLPFALGKALKSKRFKNKKKIYVLLSDGELDEGSNWESLLFSSHHKLKNLTIIVDYNKLQSIDTIKNTLNLEPLKQKFEAFGCKVLSIDGHNFKHILKALNSKSSKPLVIIANTIKGKGVSFMENSVLWHYKSLDLSDYKKAIKLVK